MALLQHLPLGDLLQGKVLQPGGLLLGITPAAAAAAEQGEQQGGQQQQQGGSSSSINPLS